MASEIHPNFIKTNQKFFHKEHDSSGITKKEQLVTDETAN